MKNARRGWTLGSVLIVAIASTTLPSFAQPATQQVAIERARFKAAQQLYDKHDYSGALALFQDVVRLNNSPNARLYVARCLHELGRLAEAYEEMTIVVRDADALAATETRYVATRDAAAVERVALASKVALVTIAVADQPSELVVKVNDRSIDTTRLREAIAVMPGAVIVDVSAPGREPFHKEWTMAAGGSESIAVVLRERSAAPDKPKPATTRGSGGLRKAGFAVLGVGALGGVTFAIAGIMAKSKYDEIVEACGGVRCTDPKFNDEINTGKTLDTVANIGLGVGIAGVLGGAAMVIFGGPKEIPVSAGASSDGGWISYRTRF